MSCLGECLLISFKMRSPLVSEGLKRSGHSACLGMRPANGPSKLLCMVRGRGEGNADVEAVLLESPGIGFSNMIVDRGLEGVEVTIGNSVTSRS